MKPAEYIAQAIQTESSMQPLVRFVCEMRTRTGEPQGAQMRLNRLLHGAMGISTEAGELLDPLKKCLFYGKPVDVTNVQEEIGDLFWYLAILCDALGITFEEVWEQNIAKLRTRYADKFTEYDALNRDLDQERKTLEGK